ncbi:MAG: hypothetical protein ACRENI_07725 [Gemmatimonadaceae bacterium]
MITERSDRDISAIMRDGRLVGEAITAAHAELVRTHRLLGLPLVVWRDGGVAFVPASEFAWVEELHRKRREGGHGQAADEGASLGK